MTEGHRLPNGHTYANNPCWHNALLQRYKVSHGSVATKILGGKMNKSELIDAIADYTGTAKAGASRSLDAFIDTIVNVLKGGDEVSIPGFGTFSVAYRAPRSYKHFQTGVTFEAEGKRVPKFKPGKTLKEAVLTETEA